MGTKVNRQTVFEIKKGFKLKFIFKGKFERNLRVTSLGVRTFRINLSISYGICVLNTERNIKFILGNSNYWYVCGFNSIKEAANDSLKQFQRKTIIGKKNSSGAYLVNFSGKILIIRR